MARRKNIHLLLLIGALFFVNGCSNLSTYQSSVASHTANFLPALDRELKAGGAEVGYAAERSLSFKAACIQAAMVDQGIVKQLLELEKAKIRVESAASNAWPRLDLQLKTELLVGNSDSDEVESTGGIYARYDIIKAFTSGDEKSIQEAYVLKNMIDIKLAINKLAENLYSQLLIISSARFKLQKRREILEMTGKASKLATIYGEQKRVSSKDVWQWAASVDRQKANVLQAEKELLIAERTLSTYLGLPGSLKIVIVDAEELLGEQDIDRGLPSPSAIWSRHGKARLAEINYMVAEANLKRAKISGWPKVTANFGVGSIPISNESDTSDSVVAFSVQVPLFDMGDQRRQVTEAAITFDMVKTGLEKMAEILWIGADNAFVRHEQIALHFEQIVALYNKALGEQNNKRKLYEEHYIDTLDVVPQRTQLMEMEMEMREVADGVKEAAIAYKLAVGNDFSPGFSSALLNDLLAKRAVVSPR